MRASILILLVILTLATGSENVWAGEITLSTQCPASFEKQAGHCKLRSIYTDYASLQSAGVGGLKTGLPPLREGFSAEQMDLGRYLFFDPILSGNGKQSCASCHSPDKGFSDGRPRSIGASGQETTRNAPSLWNVGFLTKFFWDGRATSLEAQMKGPLYSTIEMASSPEKILANLNGNKEYRRLFALAYADTNVKNAEAKNASATSINIEQVYHAIAAFETTLISLNSRYDLYAHGVPDALTKPELEGLNVFRSFVARCAECHTPPLFTNQQIVVIGTPEAAGRSFDPGAGAISHDPNLRGGFKVPSLRNVELTAPYMHSGRFATLRDVVSFYNEGRGHAVPKNETLHLHWHIHEPKLSNAELDRLVDFLKTLTDESFKPQRPSVVPSGLPLMLNK
ncbi:cytochrome-c peroxidase [Solimicrobium silvestre]|uniref:Cytochrome c peroxidase n=1 Tax=Solimicrobium silvestre TaxID=2099400 RepID=A0A2S9GVW0_9BURK|nr:cytochrome c peroxidase [Solimicrobium silvestre]PRC91865.1 Cytochrome c peroxidase [Solimicrobium silvestre]